MNCCPRCGAVLEPGEACRERFDALQLKELASPDYYAVQLVALKSTRAVDAWVKSRELTGVSVARIAKDGEVLYVVLLGVYPDRASAMQAADERPPSLRDVVPWIRKVASLQAAMRAAAQLP